MNLKKLSLAALSLALSAGLLAGCAGGGTGKPSAPAGGAVKTGLSVATDAAKSKSAADDADGQVQTNAFLVAVTVGDDGVIDSCVIDAVQAKMNFNAAGELTTDIDTTFPSKNELGDEYGMKGSSSIGKEWNEQAAAFAAYAVGKTVADLEGIKVDDAGKATDADLTASVTLAVGEFVPGIKAAVENATNLGAQKGDKLSLASVTNMSKSKDAADDAEGQAQAYTTMAAVTMNGDKITSCYIDAVQATVKFDATGVLTTDLTVPFQTKNELGDEYGMKGSSSIGKEWNEQAAAFSAYVTGKTVAEVKGIKVDDEGKATEADLTASVTVGIGEFQELIEKAAK